MKLELLGPALCALLLFPSAAPAWLRVLHDDRDLVKRSEVIVVGKIKANSLIYVATPDGGRPGWEHHATLIVTDVLKGKCKKQVPIIIHYGLDPLIGSHIDLPSRLRIDIRRSGHKYAKDAILILDTGDSSVSLEPLVEDAGKEQLWFLRRSAGPLGDGAVANKLGIVEPEDLQPLRMRRYYQAHLAKAPEKAMAAILGADDVAAKAGRYYLKLVAVERLRNDPDLMTRSAKLAEYYLQAQPSWATSEPCAAQRAKLYWTTRRALVACGPAAGPHLLPRFSASRRLGIRMDIMDLWGEIRYPGAVDLLTKLLVKQGEYWAQQKLSGNWWHDDSGKIGEERHDMAYEAECAVTALGKIGDPRAREAIERTRKRWQAINVPLPERGGPPAIAEACTAALKEIEEGKP